MNRTIQPAPIRKSLEVNASPDRAFEVFTAGFDRWWPRSHTIGASPLKQAVIEPRGGGAWYGLGEDGSRCAWGDVLVWEPPVRLVLAWRINAVWKYDPGLLTEIEVTFTDLGGRRTRVDFEHRGLERMGDDEAAEATRGRLGSPDGWGGLLALFKAKAEEGDPA